MAVSLVAGFACALFWNRCFCPDFATSVPSAYEARQLRTKSASEPHLAAKWRQMPLQAFQVAKTKALYRDRLSPDFAVDRLKEYRRIFDAIL
ncbi:MAG: hypothetical protein LBN33_00720 [Desulfovibrio sp.]|jgi:hypothetical protein|nr:hypothetical protein [Desulfovibrio sp.]